MQRSQGGPDLALQQQLQQQKEQEVEQRLPKALEQVQQNIGETLRNYTPEQQKTLTEALARDVAKKGNPPNVGYIYLSKEGHLMAQVNRSYAHIDVNQVLAKSTPVQSQEPSNLAIAPDRLQNIQQSQNILKVQETLQGFSPEQRKQLIDALTAQMDEKGGAKPQLQYFGLTEDKRLMAVLGNRTIVKIDPQTVLTQQKEQQASLAEPILEKDNTLQTTIAKQGDAAIDVAKRLDPDNPEAALGHLLYSKQVKYIKGDNGHIIPNIRPGKEYSYDPEQYSEEAKQSLNKKAREGIGQESSINANIDRQQAQLAQAKAAEQARLAQEQKQQTSVSQQGGMSYDPYMQRMQEEQKFSPLRRSFPYDSPSNLAVLGTLGIGHAQFGAVRQSTFYSELPVVTQPKEKSFVDRAIDTISQPLNYVASFKDTVVNDVSKRYQNAENIVSNALKVDADDHTFTAHFKRRAASNIATIRGAGLWVGETVSGTVDLAVGVGKFGMTSQLQSLDNITFGSLSKLAPDTMKSVRANNEQAIQTVTNVAKSGASLVVDSQLNQLNMMSFGTLGKNFDTFKEATERHNQRAEQVLSWGEKKIRDHNQAYLTGDFKVQSETVKTTIDVGTFFLPMAKGKTLSQLGKAGDVLADTQKVVNTLDNVADGQKLVRTIDEAQELSRAARRQTELLEATKEVLQTNAEANAALKRLQSTQVLEQTAQAERVAAESAYKTAQETLVQAEKQLVNASNKTPELSLSMHQTNLNKAAEALEQAKDAERVALLNRTRAFEEAQEAEKIVEQAINRSADLDIFNPSRPIVFVKEAPNPNSFRAQIDDILKESNLTIDQFQDLKLKRVQDLTDAEAMQLKQIRDRVPAITRETTLQKVIPEENIEKILSGQFNSEVGGYIAKVDDVSHIKSYDEILESIRLDYKDTPFIEGKNSYGVIRFKAEKPEQIGIPYGERFGGTAKDAAPATQNGFLASRNGEIIPEWVAPRSLPENGAELYRVVDGKEELVGIYMKKNGERVGRFERVNGD
ncbi:hypothetical protein [Neisseria sp. Ec49-e6-T10]|uniref:hypothetical protein n=1 Tax=Neisseria sp. Ec49-e6-T10 TaxID=3140744 RepID=UPI003EC0E0F6